MSMPLEFEGQRVVMVEFWEGDEPWMIHTLNEHGGLTQWKTEKSKAYGVLCASWTGSGGDLSWERNPYWVDPELAGRVYAAGTWKGPRQAPPASARRELPLLFGEVLTAIWHAETIWCSVCDDHHPCDETDRPCDHVWYCDEHATWSTPEGRGGSDPSYCGCPLPADGED